MPCFFSHCECKNFSDAPSDTKVGEVVPIEEYSPAAQPAKARDLLTFGMAMEMVGDGKRVTREEWADENIWVMLFMWGTINPDTPAAQYLSVRHATGAMRPLYVNDGDLKGQDWYVLD